MPTTRSLSFLPLCLMIGFLGCGAISKRPDPDWVKDFARADTIVLRQKDAAPITVTDSGTIKRLQGIYEGSQWSPYWHTLPGNIGDQTIDIYDGEIKMRSFSYTGTLWESESYTENRTTELSDVDRRWIDSLFKSN